MGTIKLRLMMGTETTASSLGKVKEGAQFIFGILCVTDCIMDGYQMVGSNVLGAVLGTDDGQLPHVALQVWNMPVLLHFFSFAITQVLSFPWK